MKKKKKIEIFINNKKIKCFEKEKVFDVARKNGIEIPNLCYHSDLKIKANCRLCLVEIKNRKGLHTSCTLKAEPGMQIVTDSPDIAKARKINLELVFAQHCEKCHDCVWNFNCELLKLAKNYNVNINRFFDRKKDYPVYRFGNSLIFESCKCIDCRNCVDACHNQGIDFLEVKEKGHLFQIIPSKDKNKDCIYCGQCIVHCPAGAFQGVGEFEDIEKPFLSKGKIIFFQFAPSIRTSLGEDFGLKEGKNLTGKLVAALKKSGADKVFDVCIGADLTTIEESKELIERLEKKKNLPMFTSCCPAWVKFVEFYHPELIPNLTSVRSPQIISGGLIKTYFSKKSGLNPKDIFVVSVMPCVSKKHEIERKELKIKGLKPVDCVMTTREIIRLFKKRKIDFKNIAPLKADFPFGEPSGAGVIYGASGGVMESALRTAYKEYTGKELKNIEFKKVRGMEGVKEASIDFKGKKIRVAVVNGIKNAKEIIKRKKDFDYIEVMACPGGCVGGGGQPLPTDFITRKKRAEGLYSIDKKKKIRRAHENETVKNIYKEFLDSEEKIKNFCHTKYGI